MSNDDDPSERDFEESFGEWMAVGPDASTWSSLATPGAWVDTATIEESDEILRELNRWREQLVSIEAVFEAAVAERVAELQRAQFDRIVASLEKVVNAYRESVENLVEGSVGAVIGVSEVLVRREITATPEDLAVHIRQCLNQRDEEPTKVHLCPADGERVSSSLAATIACDPELKSGDLVIEYRDGRLDCSVETLLESFREELKSHALGLRATLSHEVHEADLAVPKL